MLRREAVGRFLWPPGLPRAPPPPVKDRPCHRRRQQPKKPSQTTSLLGSAMLTRLRPLADVGVPPSAAGHRSTTAAVGLLSNLDDGSDSPATPPSPSPSYSHVDDAADSSAPRRPEQKPKRDHLFGSGSAILQLTQPRHLGWAPTLEALHQLASVRLRHPSRLSTDPTGVLPGTPPSPSCNLTPSYSDVDDAAERSAPRRPEQRPKRKNLFGSGSAILQLTQPRHLGTDLGGPPSAGLLPAGHSSTPAPVSASSGLPVSFNRLGSRLGKPWIGRHLLSSHSSLMSHPTKRSMSTSSDRLIQDINLLSARERECSSGVQDAVEKIARHRGGIQIKTATKLKEEIQHEIEVFKINQSKEELKKLYHDKIRPGLLARGVLSPYPLNDDRCIKLLNEYKDLTSKDKLLTSIDLMEEITKLSDQHWSHLLDFLSEETFLVIEDWETSLGASFGATFYKRGVIFDGSPVYRGECDASFVENKDDKSKSRAALCTAIWSSSNEILSSLVVKDYPCGNSIEAEAAAMFLLLKDGVKLGLQTQPFEACSDCQLVFNTLWGSHHISPEDKNVDLLKMIKFARRFYTYLMPEWQQREKMFWVDGVARLSDVKIGPDKVDLRGPLMKLRSYFSGEPVFKFSQKSASLDKLMKKMKDQSRESTPLTPPLELHEKCELEVEEKNKINVLSHIITALRPSTVFVAMKKSQLDVREKILKMFEDCKIDEVSGANETCGLLFFNIKHRLLLTAKKDLWISLDSSIPEELFQNKSSFTVFLRTPTEMKVGPRLPDLSPLSFISFHNTISPAAKRERRPHPNTKWTQRSDKLLLVIELPESKDIVLDLKHDRHFHFLAKGADGMPYELDLELFNSIDLEDIKETIGPKDVRYLVKKADSKLWPRLLKKKGNPPAFLKMDTKLDMGAADVVNETNKDVGGKEHGGGSPEAPKGAAKEEKP